MISVVDSPGSSADLSSRVTSGGLYPKAMRALNASLCGDCAAPAAKGIIHLGATSQYVVDNADLLIMRAIPLWDWRAEYDQPKRRIFIDVDPGFTQDPHK